MAKNVKGKTELEGKKPEPEGEPASTAGAGTGTLVDPANMSFIRYIIKVLLPMQPRGVQAAVLFVFVFLFVYIVVTSIQASIIIPTTVQVELSQDQVKKKKAAGINFVGTAYNAPPPGYTILSNGFPYALNVNGRTRIDLSIMQYALAVLKQKLDVTVQAPDGIVFEESIKFSGLGNGSMFFQPSASSLVLGSIQPSWQEGGVSLPHADPFSFIGSAHAESAPGGRLFLQAITLARAPTALSASASLLVGGTSTPFQTVSADPSAQPEATLQLKGGSSVVQDFRTFVPLSDVKMPKGASVRLQSGLFGLAYDELFPVPDNLPPGKPIAIKGNLGSSIVVQLTSPVDVVMFERRDTIAVTEALSPKLSTAAFVPRVNSNASTTPGTYNVIYSGADVPVSSLKELVKLAIDAKLDLRYIQPQVRLSNGLQNQIQIGSNAKAADCLKPIPDEKIAALKTASDEEFLKIVAALPKPSSCSN